ncbi:ABC transporter ATP-binding protein, partial [Rhizobium johnstonii]
MPEAAAIETKELAVGYAGNAETTRILSGVDLSVGRGEFM